MKKIATLATCLLLCFVTACSNAPNENRNNSDTDEINSTFPAEEATSSAETESAAAESLPAETGALSEQAEDVHVIELSEDTALLDGEPVKEYSYTWHSDPAGTYEEVKDAPGEYYTGEAPSGEESVYIAHDIFYYPAIEESAFRKVRYDGETEWVTYYTSDEYKDYIYGTLPVLGGEFPAEMMHTEEEAFANKKLHIEEAGTYVLSGEWNGQIFIDLGEDSFTDPEAKVTLVLQDATVNCTVAPGIVFYEVYECDNTWEERDTYGKIVDTKDAGAVLLIADGTVNKVSGTNIFRMLKTKRKDNEDTSEVPVQKKIRKTDGALYSYMSMNVEAGSEGTGLLTVEGGFEGLDTELHLTINGGRLVILSQDDGINVNEDGVSVLTVNGGDIRVLGGLGREGDGIDSNGFVVVNGGKLITAANPASDSGLDSDAGSYIFGGTVVALGSAMDWAEKDDSNASGQAVANLRFRSYEDAAEAIEFFDTEGNPVFSYCQAEDEALSGHLRKYQGAVISDPAIKEGETYRVKVGGIEQCYTGTDDLGGFGPGGFGGKPGNMEPPEKPEGMDFNGERPELPEGMDFGGQRPELPEGMDFGGERPEMPEGMDFGGKRPEMPEGMDFGGERPELPEGFEFDGERPELPEGMDFGRQRPGGRESWNEAGANLENASRDFFMEDKVNSFSGVTDAPSEEE